MLMSDLERLVWMYATENQKAKMEILVQKCKASPGRCLCRCVRPTHPSPSGRGRNAAESLAAADACCLSRFLYLTRFL